MELSGLSNNNLFSAQPFAQNQTSQGVGEEDRSAKETGPSRRVNGVNKAERTIGEAGDKVTISKQKVGKPKDRAEERSTEAEVGKLKAREREVIAHEAAHSAAGGQYAGAATCPLSPFEASFMSKEVDLEPRYMAPTETSLRLFKKSLPKILWSHTWSFP